MPTPFPPARHTVNPILIAPVLGAALVTPPPVSTSIGFHLVVPHDLSDARCLEVI